MKSNKEILIFAFPAIIENFLQMLVGISDTLLVAHLSLSAVAAVSLANNIITIYQAIFIALGTIISSLVAQKSSKKEDNKPLQAFINAAVKLTLYISVVIGIFSLISAYPLTTLLGAQGTVRQLSAVYLALVGGFILFLGGMTVFGALLRANGNTKTPMWASFLVNVLNLILSALFIFVFHMGVFGVALGAILARVVGSFYLYSKLKSYRPSRHLFKVRIDKELIKLVIPAAAERLSMRLGDLLIMIIIVSFGGRILAGNAIGESITQFNYMPIFGMSTVTVILVAKSYAHKNKEQINSYLHRIYWLSTIMMLAISFLIFVFSVPLNHFFTTDKVAVGASQIVILFSLLSSFFVTGTTIYTAAFQGIGNAKLPFYTTTVGMFVIRLLLGAFFGITLGMGLIGVWLGVLFDNLFRFLYLNFQFKKTIKTI